VILPTNGPLPKGRGSGRRYLCGMAFIALPARAGLALALLLPTACVDTGGPAPDRLAPSLSSRVLAHDGSTVTLPAAQVFAFNEHILLLLATRDDRRVAWIGFHVTEPVDIADSVAIPDSLDALQVLVALNLGEGFAGVVRVSGVARDAAGNRTEQVAIGNPVSVYRPLERPTPTAPLPGPVGDVALDPRRDHVYLAQPESARVLVLSLASMTFEAPIATPSAPTGLDLTASGDSLVVALAASGQLGIAALDPVPREWTLVDLIADGDGRRPTAVRVSAGNKAFVPLSGEETAGAGGVLEYDVATGVVRPRSDFDRQGPVPSGTRVTRTPDRSRIVILFAGPCCPTEGQVYESAPDTVLPVRFIAGRAEPHVSADGTARQFLIDAVLFDQALLPKQAYYPPGLGLVSALAARGAHAYFGLGAGFLRTRLADGVTVERVLLPEVPQRLLAIPGLAERVLALGNTGASLVDLGLAPPLSPPTRAPGAPSAPASVRFFVCSSSSTTTTRSPTTSSSSSVSWAPSPSCTATTPLR